ncbi:hypothetical protein GCM10025868_02860 [Angustibacter aerolatus]|uniref:Uncharacterized protein n=1 Tax=Angustibacter aerolatus TaxID=1162965 RepID=A0ABQ6JBQ6_9ACTN|nr:hypothetical protein GCM10025868_02860 [Angustibacter aerolatus]
MAARANPIRVSPPFDTRAFIEPEVSTASSTALCRSRADHACSASVTTVSPGSPGSSRGSGASDPADPDRAVAVAGTTVHPASSSGCDPARVVR